MIPAIPRITVEGFTHRPPAPRISLGHADLSYAVLSILAQPGRLDAWRRDHISITLDHIIQYLPANMTIAAWKGALVLPDLENAIAIMAAAVEAAGGSEHIKQNLDQVRRIDELVSQAEATLSYVEKADWVPHATNFGVVYGRQFPGDYQTTEDLAKVLSSWEKDRWMRIQAYQAGDAPPGQSEAQMKSYESWVRETVPPFAFGTETRIWPGLQAHDIRRVLADERMATPMESQTTQTEWTADLIRDYVTAIVKSEHEDAIGSIVDLDGLVHFIDRWMPYAGCGNTEDLALEGYLAEWSDKQTIATFRPDFSVIVPLFPGVEQSDAIAWCRRDLERAKAALSAVGSQANLELS